MQQTKSTCSSFLYSIGLRSEKNGFCPSGKGMLSWLGINKIIECPEKNLIVKQTNQNYVRMLRIILEAGGWVNLIN